MKNEEIQDMMRLINENTHPPKKVKYYQAGGVRDTETSLLQLLEDQRDLPYKRITPYFFKAVRTNKVYSVQAFLEYGLSPDVQDEDGNTALIWAVRKENIKMIHLLLDAGAEIDIENKYGKSALHYIHTPKQLRPFSEKGLINDKALGNILFKLSLVAAVIECDDVARDLREAAVKLNNERASEITAHFPSEKNKLPTKVPANSLFQPKKKTDNLEPSASQRLVKNE